MTRLRTRLPARLLGLAATLGLVAFVIGTPALLIAIHATPSPSAFTWARLTSPDDGTLAAAVIGVVAWIAWAIFTASVVLDVAARARGLRPPDIPGLAIPQLAAGRLVGIAALLFVAVPAVLSASAMTVAPRAEAAAAPSTPMASPMAAPATAPIAVAHAAHTPAPRLEKATEQTEQTEPYTVKRGDSLWKIAKEHLGDGARYVELADLNRDVLHGEPDFLIPGTRLRVPVEPHEPDGSYVVEPGDTLSGIAKAELGDARAYPEILDASRSMKQPDGAHLTDPNLIRPGWHLTIPGDPDQAVAMPRHRSNATPAPTEPSTPVGTVPTSARQRTTQTPPQDTTAPHASTESTNPDTDLPRWVLPGLAGAGAALAGALLLTLRQHRRTQLRSRRPGHIIAPPPPELHPAEKSAQASGSITAPRIEVLDRALRHLGGPGRPGPRLLTAALTTDQIKLRLAEARDLGAPWAGEGAEWSIPVTEVPPERSGTIAPYPLLVSVGMNEDGALVLINLEELRSVVLTGDLERAKALGRHVAAELSLNPWSQLVEIDALGIGGELADIDPFRLHHHADDDTEFLERLAGDLEAEDPLQEPDQYRALITTASATDAEATRRVAKIITSYAGRVGAAILSIGGEPLETDVEVRLTDAGHLAAADPAIGLDLDLAAAGLTPEEAHACATLVDLTRDATNVPAPLPQAPDSCADATGALTSDLTRPRDTLGPVGPTSLLPLAVTAYQDSGAVVAEDIETLAPRAVADATGRVIEHDPELDEDLARWQAPSLVGPKLTLLGPVSARTLGDAHQIAHRRPYYVELLAFLVLHPRGATAEEVAGALGIGPDRARKDLGILRSWLGRDPHTGNLHLPNARQTHTDGVHAKYTVHGVATDMDLFRRLRTRGQCRGAEGINDLRLALTLVSGEPFTDLRPIGWGWLLDGDRHDHLMSCAIVDTAHIVTTHALTTGDLDLARFSAATAYRAAPYDETSRLDLIAVDKALAQDEEAERLLTEGVLNRSDDDLGPIEIPGRTEEIIRRRGWTAERQARSAG